MLGSKIASSIAHGFYTSAIAVRQELSNHRPARQYLLNHIDSPGALKPLLGWIVLLLVDDLICLETACDFHSFYSLEIRKSTRERVATDFMKADVALCIPPFSALEGRKPSPKQKRCSAQVARGSVDCDVGSTRPVNPRTQRLLLVHAI
jgi:hypothetical protein